MAALDLPVVDALGMIGNCRSSWSACFHSSCDAPCVGSKQRIGRFAMEDTMALLGQRGRSAKLLLHIHYEIQNEIP